MTRGGKNKKMWFCAHSYNSRASQESDQSQTAYSPAASDSEGMRRTQGHRRTPTDEKAAARCADSRSVKESYMAQNSLELELPSRSSPPFYGKQRTVTRRKKKWTLRLITPSSQLVQPLADLQNSLPQPFKR